MIKNFKWLLFVSLAFVACDNNDLEDDVVQLAPLTAGSADFSKYVAVGNSLTAGFSDNALFKAGQQNSYPNILAQQFAEVGGGEFKIPYLGDDNLGGLLFAGNVIQHRFVWSGEALKPKFSKISPMAGAKRIFGKQAAANFAKGLFKVLALGAVMTAVLWPERSRLDAMVRLDPNTLLGTTRTLTLELLGAVVAMLALVAIADYFFQYRQWFERQKMSLREMKEEFKQSEGDPHIKARIRQLRHARMKKRMMAAVPKASVIITNPTHYSVALSYERGMSAPVCVAKGMDNIALKIREVAREHDIPIVENVPLARALYAAVKIDDEIPVDHYHAVAEIIGYVMGLKRGLSGSRV